MHLIKISLLVGFLAIISSCHKEDIHPNESVRGPLKSTNARTTDCNQNGMSTSNSGSNNGTSTSSQDGGITDPNSDEDQNRKKKTKI